MTFALAILFLLLIKSNDNRYGIALSHKAFKRLLAKNHEALDVIDIRNKERFEESHAIGSQHCSLSKLSQTKGRKLVIVHDSNIKLADYFRENNLKQFSDHIYQTNMIDHNLRQYHLAGGVFKGNELSALIKNSESA